MVDLTKILFRPELKFKGDIDSSEALDWHRKLILQKPFLKKLYMDFYRKLGRHLPAGALKVLEIGSGGGFIKEILPDVITSDIKKTNVVDKVFSAENLPFEPGTLDAIVMLNVFHHLHDAESCLKSFSRCLRQGGKIVMIEPANTPWRRWVDSHFHDETFDPQAGWKIQKQGPMSAANGALAWIIFSRDREIFYNKFPEFEIKGLRLHTTFRYIASGGLSYCQILPTWMYSVVLFFEICLTPLMPWVGYFQTIVIERK